MVCLQVIHEAHGALQPGLWNARLGKVLRDVKKINRPLNRTLCGFMLLGAAFHASESMGVERSASLGLGLPACLPHYLVDGVVKNGLSSISAASWEFPNSWSTVWRP